MKIWPLEAKGWAVVVWVFAAAMRLTLGICAARHLNMLESSERLQDIILGCLIAQWLSVDSRGRGILRVWDMGYFTCTAWQFLVPYYLVKSRGAKRALFSLLLFTVVYLGAYGSGRVLFGWGR